MRADTLNAKDLFEKNVRYVIPTFQRPYVWNQEDQWEPLWLDVENAAERYLDALAASGDDAAKAEKVAGRHFLGAIVVQQELTGAAEIETRNVIDGQQRLTTMQILLDAAQQVSEAQGWEEVAEGLTDLVLNNKRYARKNADHVFKLWPTSTDRDAFRAVMKNDADTEAFAGSQIVAAHEYFRLRIVDWVEKAPLGSERQARIYALETALLGLLELVVIDLESADDAFVIFETLNARGTPLRPSDLVKNYLMQTVAAEGGSPDAIHAAYWVQFEREEWWRKDVRQGRLTRPRIDVFLDYWLELVTRDEVASHDVFPVFRRIVEQEDRSIVGVVAEIQRDGRTYRAMDDIDGSPEGTFLYRWRTMDVGTSTPLLLWLFGQPEDVLSREERLACLRTLESFLVRRMVGRSPRRTTTSSSSKCSSDWSTTGRRGRTRRSRATCWSRHPMLAAGRPTPNSSATSPGSRSIGSSHVAVCACSSKRSRTRSAARTRKTSSSSARSSPSSTCSRSRGRPTGRSRRATRSRRRSTANGSSIRIGNLTLVTGRLNPGLSNNPWHDKREELGTHRAPHEQAFPRRHHPTTWSEREIEERGRQLAERAVRIWPRPATVMTAPIVLAPGNQGRSTTGSGACSSGSPRRCHRPSSCIRTCRSRSATGSWSSATSSCSGPTACGWSR
jgi:hypothetical protein